jgi:hypothetical protein
MLDMADGRHRQVVHHSVRRDLMHEPFRRGYSPAPSMTGTAHPSSSSSCDSLGMPYRMRSRRRRGSY